MTQPTPDERARQQYENAEKKAAQAMERLVGSEAFAESLAMFAGNLTALVRVADLGLDQLVRATRLAGRADIARLGRQIARTEDKLENVLVVVESLEAELVATRRERDEARTALAGEGAAPSRPARTMRRSSAESIRPSRGSEEAGTGGDVTGGGR